MIMLSVVSDILSRFRGPVKGLRLEFEDYRVLTYYCVWSFGVV